MSIVEHPEFWYVVSPFAYLVIAGMVYALSRERGESEDIAWLGGIIWPALLMYLLVHIPMFLGAKFVLTLRKR